MMLWGRFVKFVGSIHRRLPGRFAAERGDNMPSKEIFSQLFVLPRSFVGGGFIMVCMNERFLFYSALREDDTDYPRQKVRLLVKLRSGWL